MIVTTGARLGRSFSTAAAFWAALSASFCAEAAAVAFSPSAFFVAVFLALVWPVYALFSGIRPRILGLPLSLAWVVGWVVAGFLALLAVHLWEARRGDG